MNSAHSMGQTDRRRVELSAGYIQVSLLAGGLQLAYARSPPSLFFNVYCVMDYIQYIPRPSGMSIDLFVSVGVNKWQDIHST